MTISAKTGGAITLPRLELFRGMTFGRGAPDHPLSGEAEVAKMLATLPAEPGAALAELTDWIGSINADDTFSPSRRARVLMALDPAVRDCAGALATDYLAPRGRPAEGRDGDAGVVRELLRATTGLADGYGFALESAPSGWIEKNLAQIVLRRARWLARRLILANMLHQPNAASIWEELRALYALAQEHQVARTLLRAFPGDTFTTSVRQEYVRALMVEIAGQDTLRGREVELAYRIAGRAAASARLEQERLPEALYLVPSTGASRPVLAQRIAGMDRDALYLDTSNCLPRLHAMLERDMDRDPADADTLFRQEFTVRERTAMLRRLLEHWGPNPPRRRAHRVALDAPVLVRCGFDAVAQVIPASAQDPSRLPGERRALRIAFEDAERVEAKAPAKTVREERARLADVSVAGLGMIVPRKNAAWAKLGMLLAIYVQPGPDWIVGTLRRISAEGDDLRLGIRILARQPKLRWFHLESSGLETVWDDAKRFEQNFHEHYQRGILLDPDRAHATSGEMLLPRGAASVGGRLDFPLEDGMQSVRVAAVRESADEYQRVAFEPLRA